MQTQYNKVHGWGGERDAGRQGSEAEGGCTSTTVACQVAEDTVEIRIGKRNEELPEQLLAAPSPPSPHVPRACA